MPNTSVTFSNLPWVVQDCILDKLDRATLVSVSLTTSSLYHASRKHLYRNVIHYEPYHALVENNIRRHPAVIQHIREFWSYDVSFLVWMWSQTIPRLERLVLRWEDATEESYSKLIESIPPAARVESLVFDISKSCGVSLLGQLHAFMGLRYLLLEGEEGNMLTLQSILEGLNAPFLERLEVVDVLDWRITWQASFKDILPSLCGLLLWLDEATYMSDEYVMFDHDDEWPNDVSWESALVLHRQSIFFQVSGKGLPALYFDSAPSYCLRHHLDPVPIIQWLVKSQMYFSTTSDVFSINLGDLTKSDLIVLFDAIKSLDLGGTTLDLKIYLPPSSQPSIAHHLSTAIACLTIRTSMSNPDVLPECIRSLPRLRILRIILPGYNRVIRVTAAKFAVPATERKRHVHFSRFRSPVWNYGGWNPHENLQESKLDYNVGAFETEVKEWFGLNTSLESLEISFD
jgi:hypothetical protein